MKQWEKSCRSKIWFEFIFGNVCGLCQNKGYLEVKDRFGNKEFRYCICPNGRQYKIKRVRIPFNEI